MLNLRKLVLFLGSALLLAGTSRPAAAVSVDDTTVLGEGISALGEDLSGLTLGEARSRINGYYDALANSDLTVTFDGQQESITLGELGLTWDADSALAEAAGVGKSGSVITQYKSRKDLKANSLDITVVYTYDISAVENFVTERVASHDTEPQNASLRRDENRNFVVTEDVHGMTTDVEATVASITDLLDHHIDSDLTVEATVELAMPEITTEMMAAVQDKLGTFHTDYSSSSGARKTNIRIASQRIDGTILMPGEAFSLSRTILDRTPENGYEMAPQYVNGDTELSYGGGVCQVSTTLYNAVIRAELEIDERHPHSMVVNYVPYSSDAAIAEGNKDFVFTNNLDYPVYIASDADGEGLYFSIYGKETRSPDRSIEFVSDTISYTESEPKVVEDPDMPAGEERTEGSSHPAVSSTLTKVVYENGEVVSRELMNSDSYMGTSKTIYRGTGGNEETLEDIAEVEMEEVQEEETKAKKKKKKKKETEAAEEEIYEEEFMELDED